MDCPLWLARRATVSPVGVSCQACRVSRDRSAGTDLAPGAPWTRRQAEAARVRGLAAAVAPGLGVAHLWLILGLSVANQFLYAQRYSRDISWVYGGAEPLLWPAAISGGVTAIVALLSGRLPRAVIAFGILVTIWQGSVAVSALARDGDLDSRRLLLTVACAGLAFGVAAAGPSWSGLSLFAIGTAYVWLNLLALWRNYYSLGDEFPVAATWWDGTDRVTSVPTPHPSLLFPESLVDRLLAVVRSAPEQRVYVFRGLTRNQNLTGNYLAPLLAFMAALSIRWRPRNTGRQQIAVRVVALMFAVLPGCYLLYALQARTALAAVAVSLGLLLVPLRKGSLARAAPWLAALVPTAVILAPLAVAGLANNRFSGRDCAWSSMWSAVRQEPLWGIGPGRFPDTCALLPEGWVHAHNELLQAWGTGGLLGLVAFTLLLSGLAWFALRFHERDRRALLAVLVCCLVVFGAEILSPFSENWVPMGLAGFVAIASRSLALMSHPGRRPPASSGNRSPETGE